MRSAAFVAILVATAALLAGCSSSKKDTELLYTCPATGTVTAHVTISGSAHPSVNTTAGLAKFCPGARSATNSTSLAPNILPVLTLVIRDQGGNKTNVTMLDGNLTFDATGSHDPDGQVTGIAVTVQDSNQTRTAALFDPVKKAFKPATFKFDRPGKVNVTVAMVDDRAGFTINQTHVYVDQSQDLGSHNFQAGDLSKAGNDGCAGFDKIPGQTATNELLSYQFSIASVPGLTQIVASWTGDADGIICDPSGNPVSPGGASPQTTTGALPPPQGINGYTLVVYSTGGPTPPATANTVTASSVVHYEPVKAK